MRTKSIRFKTSVLYSSILCVILVCFSFYLFHMVRGIDYEEVESDLSIKADQIASFLNAYALISINEDSPGALMNQFLSSNGEAVTDTDVINKLWLQDSRSLGLQKDIFRILNPKGTVVLRSENTTPMTDRAFDTQFMHHVDKVYFMRLQFNKGEYYGIIYPFRFSNHNTYILQLATPLNSIQRVLSKLEYFIIGGIGGILLVTLFMGSFLTRRILRSVTEITKVADSISQKNLNLRIPEQELDQEMEQLVKSFNRMIDRLEHSFAHVNEFSSHVAHELKTPLAIIKNELELALNKRDIKDEDKRVMKVALGEVDRLVKTIKDLLLLAKLEYQLNIFKKEKIDFIEFINDVYQDCKVLAEEKKIRMALLVPERPISIQGDIVHLRRIFFNLVHNAVKFTPSKGEITITAEVQDKQVFVSVKDTGIGIAVADQPRIFEKFYRIRRMDQEDAGGNGLGLSMARAVARSHGGDITLKSELSQGSVFTVILPLVSN